MCVLLKPFATSYNEQCNTNNDNNNNWKRDRCLARDTTCPDTFAQSYVQLASSIQARSAAAATAAEEKKTQTYSGIVCYLLVFVHGELYNNYVGRSRDCTVPLATTNF